ncbi:MAG: SDR family oxidoreductase [Bauldia sp.]|nr:SDR family oxidoreductase [Bauldia sp.]
MRLFVFGLGNSASTIARELSGEAASVVGTVRTLAAEPTAAPAIVFDGLHPSPEVTAALADATHLLVSIPPGETGDPVLAHHAADILEAPRLRWIGYLSTVGVYGDHGGAWVDESTPCHPGQPRSRHRLAAEEAWQALAARKGVPLATFRLAGIYGPGRNALASLADGEARRIVKPGQVFNRIQVEDIAGAVAAALRLGADGIFNLADDEPAPPQDVVAFAAGLMGVPAPPEIPFAEASLSPMGRSFYSENRRVSNARLKRELGVALRFPTYREGLAALWRTGAWR